MRYNSKSYLIYGTPAELIIKFCYIIICLTIFSCKKPEADFSTDKQNYVSGEEVTLTNFSSEADGVEWILPDGTHNTKSVVTCTIPDNYGFGMLNFTLKAKKDYRRKTSDKTKSVFVVPQSSFSNVYQGTPQIKFMHAGIYSGSKITFGVSTDGSGAQLNVSFNNSQFPSPGTYSVVSGALQPGQANVQFYSYGVSPNTLSASSGLVQFEILNGAYHIKFDTLPNNFSPFKWSGELFVPNN